MSILSRLVQGLSRSARHVTQNLEGLFTGKQTLDDQRLAELEDVLILADLGPKLAQRLAHELRIVRFGKQVSAEDVKEFLAEKLEIILSPVMRSLPNLAEFRQTLSDQPKLPMVILMVGVNGSGKTTTLGKLALHYRQEGGQPLLIAGDTWRAAAVEQLGIWASRAQVPLMAAETGRDASALVYDGLVKARADQRDIVLVDTAGRLQNRDDLMRELAKLVRTCGKAQDSAPHHIWLVLDATTGQNALSQVKIFQELVKVSGLIVTKLDGTARGGVVVALAEQFSIPIYALGVGEGIEDLRPFAAKDFARALVGLDPQG